MRRVLLTSLVAILAAMVAGCGPAKVTPQSKLDDPGIHVSQGKRHVARGELTQARTEFERAKSLKHDYAPATAGLALVALVEKDYEKCGKLVDKAKSIDKNCMDARIVNIRLLSRARPGKSWFLQRADWIDRVDSEAKAGLKKDPKNAELNFYYGLALKRALRFDDAARHFAATIALKGGEGDFDKDADREWKLMQKIQRAKPGTRMGKKVALVEKVTRAEIAVLFVDEMKLAEVVRNRTPQTFETTEADRTLTPGVAAKMPSDIGGHWAESFLKDAVKLGALEAKPTGLIEPDSPITRGEFAYLCQNMIVLITQDKSLLTRYIGAAKRFRDVRADDWRANAITLCATRGIMTADTISGAFKPDDPITGADALIIIRNLKQNLRLKF
jgi:tetratricopeptide (TPR) repeat protein